LRKDICARSVPDHEPKRVQMVQRLACGCKHKQQWHGVAMVHAYWHCVSGVDSRCHWYARSASVAMVGYGVAGETSHAKHGGYPHEVTPRSCTPVGGCMQDARSAGVPPYNCTQYLQNGHGVACQMHAPMPTLVKGRYAP
jgi:hypothetical protein